MRKSQHDRTEKRAETMIKKLFPKGEVLNFHISRDRFFTAYVKSEEMTYEIKYGRADHIEFRKRNMAGRSLYSIWVSVYLDNKLITENPLYTSCVDVKDGYNIFPTAQEEHYTEEGCYSPLVDEAFKEAVSGADKNLKELKSSIEVARAALSK
jgi:hypothetical protein